MLLDSILGHLVLATCFIAALVRIYNQTDDKSFCTVEHRVLYSYKILRDLYFVDVTNSAFAILFSACPSQISQILVMFLMFSCGDGIMSNISKFKHGEPQ